MAKRPCLDCPTVIASGSRCAACKARRERGRGTKRERGYNAPYYAARRHYEQRMAAGEVFTCWRCAELGRPHLVDPKTWHLGHDNADRSVIRGPQCPASNLATGGDPRA